MEDNAFEEKLKKIGLPEEKIKEIIKKKKSAERVKYVIEQSKIENEDKEMALILIQVAEKLNPAYNHRLPLLLKYVLSRQITTSQQLDAAVAFFRKKGEENIDEDEFKNICGCGKKLSEAELEKEIEDLIQANSSKISLYRFHYQEIDIINKLKKKHAFIDQKKAKEIAVKKICNFLGGRNKEEIKEKEIREELEELKKKSKKDKSKITEAEKKRMTEIKAELKKIDDEFNKRIKEEEEKKKSDPNKKEEVVEEEVNEKDMLSKLMAREMKSLLNPPDIWKKHIEFTKGKVYTRFPPEPNGYLHLGHAKAMRFCFNSAAQAGGYCYLRLDDTNPAKESLEFIESIKENVQWLGYKPFKVTFASDYLDDLYKIAIKIIKKGLAYVDDLTQEEMKQYREQHRDSPYRTRTPEENLLLFERMRQGRYDEGEKCLRLKIDNQSKNPCMWDPVAYRIKYVPHPHVGDKWCIYPTYDFTHCLNDSLENITHSLCTLEFEIRRDSYYWLLEAAEMYRPFVWEYSRLNVSHIVVSKRKLIQLVDNHIVTGWDDPRMPTIEGLRRRGYTPEAINNFIDSVGVTRRGNENMVPISWLEDSLRKNLNETAERTLAVLDPLKVILKNMNEEISVESFLFPKLKSAGGTRKILLSHVIYIERSDFREKADKDFYGLAPGQDVGLKYCGILSLLEIVKDDKGKVKELICSYSTDSRKVKGRIHWLSDKDAKNAEVRLYGYLFKSEDPFNGGKTDPLSDVNPLSLLSLPSSLVHFSLCENFAPGKKWQFERLGYFVGDKEGTTVFPVFNLSVSLGDGKVERILEEKAKEKM